MRVPEETNTPLPMKRGTMRAAIGETIPLSVGRRLTSDFVNVSTALPLVAIQKAMPLAELVAARHHAQPRPSWCGIFTKAYAIVVSRRAELRRALLTIPYERMFQYLATSADVVIEAPYGGEDILVMKPLIAPESWPLAEIDLQLSRAKADPVMRVRKFRNVLKIVGLPAWLRRRIWWFMLNYSGRKRLRYFSTFGVSSIGNFGCDSLRPLGPWTTLLHYGALDSQGSVTIRLTFDHRVFDGSTAARAMNELETVLKTELLTELRSLAPLQVNAA